MDDEIDIGELRHIPDTPTVVYFDTGGIGATEIPLHALYQMFVAVRKGQAQIRFRDTSYGRIFVFIDVDAIDHRKTFGELYDERDFR